jgi:hypothetical protein
MVDPTNIIGLKLCNNCNQQNENAIKLYLTERVGQSYAY